MATGTGKALLCFDNLVDRSTLTASSAAATAPVTNLQDYRPKIQWVANDNTPWVQGTTGAPETLKVAILWNHNGLPAGDLRWRAGADPAFLAAAVDQTFDMWAPVYGLGEGGLGENGLGGYPVLSDFSAWSPYRVLLLPQSEQPYWRLDLLDPTNPAPSRAGRLYIGNYVQVGRNFNNDWSLGYEDDGGVVKTDGGSLRKKIKGRRRILALTFRFITESEALTTFDDLQRMIGITGDMFVILFPDAAPSRQYRTTIYGIPSLNGPVKGEGSPAPRRYSFGLTLRELT